MEVLTEGHRYRLRNLKGDGYTDLQFYQDPEINGGAVVHGPSCQEVIRALIDRVAFLDNQKPWWGNKLIITCLRKSLTLFEMRALERKVEKGLEIEKLPVGKDGHLSFIKHINIIPAKPIVIEEDNG